MRKTILGLGVAIAVTLGGCTAMQIETAVTSVESTIQSGVAVACGVVPELNTIISVAGVLFPGIASITALTSAGIVAVEHDICSAAPPVASLRYKSLPRYGAYPAPIGTTVHGVPVTGWRP